MRHPIKVGMIVLNKNLKPTGEYEYFGSMTEAAKVIGRPTSAVSFILDPNDSRKITTDQRTGNIVTFVRADATEEKVLEWLEKVETKKSQPYPVKIGMIVLDKDLKPTGEYEYFESMAEAGKAIGKSTIVYEIINPKTHSKTTTDKRTGNTVTFVRADATKEEILEWLKKVQDEEKPPVKVKMIVLDKNLKPTGEYEYFESMAEAGKAIDKSTIVSQILNPKLYNKTTIDQRTGSTVTFVRADATEEEILEWLKEVENKKSQPRKIKVVYVESDKIEYFTSLGKASQSTGADIKTIKNDIEKKHKNPRKRYHKDTNEEIEFYKA